MQSGISRLSAHQEKKKTYRSGGAGEGGYQSNISLTRHGVSTGGQNAANGISVA